MAIPKDEKYFVSAAADSVVTFWEDCTELEEEEKLAAKADIVLKCVLPECTETPCAKGSIM